MQERGRYTLFLHPSLPSRGPEPSTSQSTGKRTGSWTTQELGHCRVKVTQPVSDKELKQQLRTTPEHSPPLALLRTSPLLSTLLTGPASASTKEKYPPPFCDTSGFIYAVSVTSVLLFYTETNQSTLENSTSCPLVTKTFMCLRHHSSSDNKSKGFPSAMWWEWTPPLS